VKAVEEHTFYNCPNIHSITWKGKAYTDKDEFNNIVGVEAWT
jgi:hypothetical protein